METKGTTSTTLRDFLHVVFKRKFPILIFFCVTVAYGLIIARNSKPIYEARAQILIKIGRENFYVPTLPSRGELNPVFYRDREEQINSEVEILKSRFLAEKVAETLGPTVIYQDLISKEPKFSSYSQGFSRDRFPTSASPRSLFDKAVLRLHKNLEVEEISESNVIEVKFRHGDRDMAAKVLNTFVEKYLERHVEVHKSPRDFEFSREQAERIKQHLREVEERLQSFKKKHEITSLEDERTLLLQQQAELNVALNQTLSQEAESENRIRQLRKQLAKTPKMVVLAEEIDHTPPSIAALKSRLLDLELQERELLLKFTEQSRFVEKVRAEIQIVRQELAAYEKRRYGRTSSGLNANYQKIQADLLKNETELEALKAKKDALASQLAEAKRKLNKLNGVEVEFNQLKREFDLELSNYRVYVSKYEESRVSNAMDAEKIANVSLIEPARPPLKPLGARKLAKMIIAVILGGFGGVGLAFVLEYRDDRLEKPEEVENYLQLPVLASIPDMKSDV